MSSLHGYLMCLKRADRLMVSQCIGIREVMSSLSSPAGGPMTLIFNRDRPSLEAKISRLSAEWCALKEQLNTMTFISTLPIELLVKVFRHYVLELHLPQDTSNRSRIINSGDPGKRLILPYAFSMIHTIKG